jgi:acyl-CoA thioesterase
LKANRKQHLSAEILQPRPEFSQRHLEIPAEVNSKVIFVRHAVFAGNHPGHFDAFEKHPKSASTPRGLQPNGNHGDAEGTEKEKWNRW